MYIHFKKCMLFFLLIFLIEQIYGQQVRFSQPMIAVKKQQPAYTIILNGKKLPVSIIDNIARINIYERLYGPGSFVIKLNSQKSEKTSFKYRKSNPFNQGDKIDILLIRDTNKPSRRLVKGTVTSVTDFSNEPDSTFFKIQGKAQKPDLTHQAVIEPTIYKIDSSNRNQFALNKKKNEDLITVAWYDKNEAIGLPDLRAGQEVQINGIGETYNGLYYISEITHTISSSGYSQHFELSRNDTN